jgi:c-di-GMP-binding flagellar brake protein YcgR
MAEEQRKFPRRPLKRAARVITRDAPPTEGVTIDVSSGGMCVMLPRQLAPGTACAVSFDIPVNAFKQSVSAVAKVAWSICSSEGFKTGLQFSEIDPASATAIARFVSGI